MGIRVVLRAMGLILAVFVLTGCQSISSGLGTRLIAHVAMIDFSGLNRPAPIPSFKVQVALPQGWDSIQPQISPLYVHRQWRSPTRSTGVGVAYIHMPLPMSAKMLLWLAKAKYSGDGASGHLDKEWTDSLGREWFQGEDSKYHVKGYVVANGFDAWVVYIGYRLYRTPNPAEIGLASRAMDSVMPLPLLKS